MTKKRLRLVETGGDKMEFVEFVETGVSARRFSTCLSCGADSSSRHVGTQNDKAGGDQTRPYTILP